jgi:tRNA(His) 5'-end guanylyltransferase
MGKDELSSRMKLYEGLQDTSLLPRVPVVARLDGRAFHSFCKGLERPFDPRLRTLMVDTTIYLARETNAKIAYTQSDEISLIWLAGKDEELFFDGRVQKMASILAAMGSVYFNGNVATLLPEKTHNIAHFDCRVFSVPSQTEAANYLIWREADACRNSISMAAQSYYSHVQLHGKKQADMHDMLHAKGINWNDYPTHFRRGIYVRGVVREIPFSAEEIEKLPQKHEARTNPDLKVRRRDWGAVELPIFTKILNREEVIFEGAEVNLSGDV